MDTLDAIFNLSIFLFILFIILFKISLIWKIINSIIFICYLSYHLCLLNDIDYASSNLAIIISQPAFVIIHILLILLFKYLYNNLLED